MLGSSLGSGSFGAVYALHGSVCPEVTSHFPGREFTAKLFHATTSGFMDVLERIEKGEKVLVNQATVRNVQEHLGYV
ncbi:hypothetical protein BESB_024170 [Besnoitia besnoiti]|uniref:Uncharacterized protein n=1 Tax=Besnoitia besnoiti TaxID=94643 RepID=A0A2A9M1R0_BESBE|nr:hypothetical protein BESB_024170 [Besnoitia besnoiti]PFH31925.1 hypothetical protein BESB_024170 [Besnoitia besnoiti]